MMDMYSVQTTGSACYIGQVVYAMAEDSCRKLNKVTDVISVVDQRGSCLVIAPTVQVQSAVLWGVEFILWNACTMAFWAKSGLNTVSKLVTPTIL